MRAKKYKMTLKRQMIISFSIAFSLILIIVVNAILRYSIEKFRNLSFDYCSKIVELNITLLDNDFEQMRKILRIIANDSRVIDAVSYRTSTERLDYAIELGHQRNINDALKQVDVVDRIENTLIIGPNNQCLYYYGDSPQKDYDFSRERWFQEAIGDSGGLAYFTDYHPRNYLLRDTESETVSIITTIVSTSHYIPTNLAYLMCDFKLEPIISKEAAYENTQIAIFNNETPMYFTQGQISEGQLNILLGNLANGQHSFMLEKEKGGACSYVVVNENSKISGWTIIGIMPVPEIDSMKSATNSFSLAMVLFSIAIVTLISLLISKSILVPMNALVNKFNKIAAGERKVAFEETRSEEVNVLSKTAQNMMVNIESLTREAIEKSRQLSQEQIKVLQHQINPHFFNNMLQSIKALALEGDTEAISRTTTLLGKILSYTVYNPLDMVRLSEELGYIGSYIALHKIRFPQIEYSIYCPEECAGVLVPKLIIQPIVENSIEHGFSRSRSGYIRIGVEEDGEDIHIIISDNGIGFDEGKLSVIKEKLACELPDPDATSIGIMNVHFRIRKIYGAGYGVSILTRKDCGTNMIITLPNRAEFSGK